MQTQLAVQDRNWAMAAHLSALVAIVGFPFGHILGPLIVYLVKCRESAFVTEHARASLNYQITLSVVTIVAAIVALAVTFGLVIPMSAAASGSGADATAGASLVALWVAIGCAFLVILVLSLIFIIQGTVAASEGRPYTYPFAIRFLR